MPQTNRTLRAKPGIASPVAEIAGRTANLTVQIPRDQLPYDVLVPVPAKQPDVEITINTATGAKLTAKLAGAALRRKLVDAGRDPSSIVYLSGQLAPGGRLTDAGLTVVIRTAAISPHAA